MQIGFCWVSDLWKERKRIHLGKGRDYLTALFDKWKKNWWWSNYELAQDLSQLFAKELRCYFSPSSAQKYPRWKKTLGHLQQGPQALILCKDFWSTNSVPCLRIKWDAENRRIAMELFILSHHLHLAVLLFLFEVHNCMSSVKVNYYDHFPILISFGLHICILVKFYYNYFLQSGNFSVYQLHQVSGESNLTGNLGVNFVYRGS